MHRLAAFLICILIASIAIADDNPQVIDVWPATAPGEDGSTPAEKTTEPKPGQRRIQRITNISKPTLTIFQPAKEKQTGAAVIIAPGGGYSILAWDYEGEEVAAWLNTIGVTGILLKYRVPRRPGESADEAPLGARRDAQRAMSLVRSKATELNIDPARIGMLGFSAGGHLTAWTSTNSDRRAYDHIDAVDDISCRPDFAVLVYPAYLLDKKNPDHLAADIRVAKNSPPAFLAHAADDHIGPQNSIQYFTALQNAKVPAELHIFATGGHGFGLRDEGKACTTWVKQCELWMREQGLLGKKLPTG